MTENKYLKLMEARHSVRNYSEKAIEPEKRRILDEYADELSKESGLRFQIIYDEPTAFANSLATYGKFKGVKNYIAVFGKAKMDETVGFYGEKLVLKAQSLGLNTCWVALTFDKSVVKKLARGDEKLYPVISLGYGENDGVPHKNKSEKSLVVVKGETPDNFDAGVRGAMLAPTAINQQKFKIKCTDGIVSIVNSGIGFYTDIDLGIVKCNFELASGIKVFEKENN